MRTPIEALIGQLKPPGSRAKRLVVFTTKDLKMVQTELEGERLAADDQPTWNRTVRREILEAVEAEIEKRGTK
jgi:hypothetical protein